MKVHPGLRYTTLRLTLFIGVLLLLSLLRIRGLLLLALAVVISGLVSYSLLSRQRDAMSSAMTERIRRMRQSINNSARAEDPRDQDVPGDRRVGG